MELLVWFPFVCKQRFDTVGVIENIWLPCHVLRILIKYEQTKYVN